MPSRSHLLILEGYDGSGKGTLAEGLGNTFTERGKTWKVITRKNEPELAPLVALIETPDRALSTEAVVLLRTALEFERLKLIKSAQARFQYVILDRGPISLSAWVMYLNLDPCRYLPPTTTLMEVLAGSKTFVCQCTFDICWSRIQTKPLKSAKEYAGREQNQIWYDQYQTTVSRLAPHFDVANIDTSCTIEQSLERTLAHLPA